MERQHYHYYYAWQVFISMHFFKRLKQSTMKISKSSTEFFEQIAYYFVKSKAMTFRWIIKLMIKRRKTTKNVLINNYHNKNVCESFFTKFKFILANVEFFL